MGGRTLSTRDSIVTSGHTCLNCLKKVDMVKPMNDEKAQVRIKHAAKVAENNGVSIPASHIKITNSANPGAENTSIDSDSPIM